MTIMGQVNFHMQTENESDGRELKGSRIIIVRNVKEKKKNLNLLLCHLRYCLSQAVSHL